MNQRGQYENYVCERPVDLKAAPTNNPQVQPDPIYQI